MPQNSSRLSLSRTASGRNQPASLDSRGNVQAGPSEYDTVPGLLRVLRRRWLEAGLVALLIAVLGVLCYFLIVPKYAAVATLEVEQQMPTEAVSSSASSVGSSAEELKNEVQTDISVLESPGLALEVIQRLHLESNRAFSKAVIRGEQGMPLDKAPRTRERLIKRFEQGLKVSSPEGTRLIGIAYESPDAVLAAEIANTLCRTFIESTQERHRQSTMESSFWLQKELRDLKVQVKASEQKLADYERTTGMAGVQLSGSANADGSSSVSVSPRNTVSERLFALNQELTAAEASRVSAETVYNLVQTQDPEQVLGLGAMNIANAGGGGAGSLTADSGVDLLRALRAQEVTLDRQYADSSVVYGKSSSRIVELRSQIEAIDRQITAELKRIRQRAQNAYLYAKRNEDTIRQQFSEQQTAANVMADKTVQLQILAQEAYSNRSLYDSLFSKLQSASLASSVRATRINLVDAARVPGSPSSPNLLKYFAVLFGLACFTGVSAAFFLESLDDTVRTPQHLRESFDVNLLGYVPQVAEIPAGDGDERNSRLIYDPMSPFSEAFRTIRTSILLGSPAVNRRSILITSAMGGEGKTTLVYNLGVAFAQQGARVLLIDADLRNPDLHRHFGTDVAPGLSEFLIGPDERGHPRVVRHHKLASLYMLPAGEQPELPAELFSLHAFDDLLRECDSKYDYVLIDSPPVLAVADSSVIATKTRGIVTVVRSGITTRSGFVALMRALVRTGTPLLGVVLNKVSQPSLDQLPVYQYVRRSKEPINANG